MAKLALAGGPQGGSHGVSLVEATTPGGRVKGKIRDVHLAVHSGGILASCLPHLGPFRAFLSPCGPLVGGRRETCPQTCPRGDGVTPQYPPRAKMDP
jgi:hypothetical protein